MPTISCSGPSLSSRNSNAIHKCAKKHRFRSFLALGGCKHVIFHVFSLVAIKKIPKKRRFHLFFALVSCKNTDSLVLRASFKHLE